MYAQKKDDITINFYHIVTKFYDSLSGMEKYGNCFLCVVYWIYWNHLVLCISALIVFIIVLGSGCSQKIFESSAYRRNFRVILSIGRSLLYNKKMIGPKIEPCGTPQLIFYNEDVESFIERFGIM